MILGRGLLAKGVEKIDNDEYLFYTNGISNSVIGPIVEDNFEAQEIIKASNSIGSKIFIYFSTSQVNSKENHARPYVNHKYRMERLVAEKFERYLIIRTSNLVGFNLWNKTTLFNYLFFALSSGSEITFCESVLRNVLDIEHLVCVLNYYLKNRFGINRTIEMANPVSYYMAEIIKAFESHFSKEFQKKNIAENNFARFEINTQLSTSLFNKCKIETEDYLPYLLKKYYPLH